MFSVFPSCLSFLTLASRWQHQSFTFVNSWLQVWNGIAINSTDFSRTPEWSKESSVVENIPGPVKNAAFSSAKNDSTSSPIKFPDPAQEEKSILPRTQVEKFLKFHSMLIFSQGGVALCRVDEFTCEDGETCLPWEKICDGISDCPLHENGAGGEDEVSVLKSL